MAGTACGSVVAVTVVARGEAAVVGESSRGCGPLLQAAIRLSAPIMTTVSCRVTFGASHVPAPSSGAAWQVELARGRVRFMAAHLLGEECEGRRGPGRADYR